MSIRRWLWPRHLAGKLAVAFGIMLIVLAGLFAAATYNAERRLEAVWRQSDEMGLPRTIEELLGPALADDRNAALPLNEAAALATRFENSAGQAIKDRQGGLEDDPRYAKLIVESANQEPAYERLLDLADKTPAFRSTTMIAHPMMSTTLAGVQDRRNMIRVENYISRRTAEAGDRDAAARRMLRQLRLTDKWAGSEPFLISQLVAIAIRIVAILELNDLLRAGILAPEVHDEIDRAAAEAARRLPGELKRALQSEKLAFLDNYPVMTPGGSVALLRPRNLDDQVWALVRMTHMQQLLDEPYWRAAPRLTALEMEFQNTMQSPTRRLMRMGSALMMPNLPAPRSAYDRTQAKLCALRIVNALARKRDWKAPLDSLNLPSEATTDPFTGKPMRIKSTEEGPIVYAFGPDGKDDDGAELGSIPGKTTWDSGLAPKKKPEPPR